MLPPECFEKPDAGAAAPGPDAAGVDPCVSPCPDCDYGVLPPECYAGPDASTSAPDAAEPCVCLDYGVMPEPGSCCYPEPADAGSDPCEDVCCECDYGVIPPGCCK